MTTPIQVAVRLRPMNNRERESIDITEVTNTAITLTNPQTNKVNQYNFDHVYDSTTSQQQIYDDIGRAAIDNALTGYNGCIFMYGQTGCFARGTPIRLADGTTKPVEQITLQDQILGDDSTIRNVQRLFSGVEMMFEICPLLPGFDSYVVNESHIMVFAKLGDGANTEFQPIEVPLRAYLAMSAADQARYQCITAQPDYPTHSDYRTQMHNNILLRMPYQVRRAVICRLLAAIAQLVIPYAAPSLELGKRIVELAKSVGHPSYLKQQADGTALIYIAAFRSTFPFTVRQLAYGTYYGFMLDGNHRFVGAGYNLLRNSGKTHTMTGTKREPGLIPRICSTLLEASLMRANACTMHITYMEIYSERIYDLLTSDRATLSIRQSAARGVYVEGLSEVKVDDLVELKSVITRGNAARTTGSTLMNSKSSRSHAILSLHFADPLAGISSTMHLVDLAGSEKISTSGVTGIAKAEAIQINLSLTVLKSVINKLILRTDKKTHIPFRESELTRILSESLGGNSKTYMIATISPSSLNFIESRSTLRYAQVATLVVNIAQVNEDQHIVDMREASATIKSLRLEIMRLKALVQHNAPALDQSIDVRYISTIPNSAAANSNSDIANTEVPSEGAPNSTVSTRAVNEVDENKSTRQINRQHDTTTLTNIPSRDGLDAHSPRSSILLENARSNRIKLAKLQCYCQRLLKKSASDRIMLAHSKTEAATTLQQLKVDVTRKIKREITVFEDMTVQNISGAETVRAAVGLLNELMGDLHT